MAGDATVSQEYIEHEGFPITGGIGDFNASFAGDIKFRGISAVLFGGDFGGFLTNLKVSYPTSPIDSTQTACVNGGDSSSTNCILSYYVSGGLELISPWPYLNYSLPESPLYTVRQNQGYHFDFSALESHATFNGVTDCSLYGEDGGATLFCFAASRNSALNMSMISLKNMNEPNYC